MQRLQFTEDEGEFQEYETPEAPRLPRTSKGHTQQKRALKRQYAAAKHGRARRTAEATAKSAKKAAEKEKELGKTVWKHRRGLGIILLIALLMAFCLNTCASMTAMLSGAGAVVTASTYPSADADMLAAEQLYCAMESSLRHYLNTYEQINDYDEYEYELDEIGHDSYVLISLLTAWHRGAWTMAEAEETIAMLFEEQYTLSGHVRTGIRMEPRPVIDPEPGEPDVETVPVPYSICTVCLDNFNLSHVPIYILDEEQLALYATYMKTLGNRPDLFPDSEYVDRYYNPDYTHYDIPPEALSDERFAAMIEEAEKYLGYPYVWGGSSPETSFDCSGFVSWVLNHSGWNVGRLGTDGLLGLCTRVSPADAKPGDLIFFEKTYDAPLTSHVGIYVGDGWMIHCGDPIQYASVNTQYWMNHFYCFGRLP